MARPALALLVLALAPGCAHRVAVTSAPAGALVSVGDTRVGMTPLEIQLAPFGPRVVRAELGGYRPLEVRLGWIPRHSLELRLVREHGPAGTWTPDDVR